MGFEPRVELRRALRALKRNPGFATAAILVLSLGIVVNAAMFTAPKSLLLESPDYPSAD